METKLEIINNKLERRIFLYNIMLVAFLIVLIGSAMNFTVTTSNKGKMPVRTSYSINTETHFSFTNDLEVKYPSLADRFSFGDWIISSGDIFLISGIIILVICFSINIFLSVKVRRLKRL